MRAVYASGKPVAVEAGQANEDDRSATESIAAGVCRNDILASYRCQLDLLEQRIGGEKRAKEQALAAERRKTLILIAAEILIGLAVTAFLALILPDGAPMIVIAGAAVVAISLVWTYILRATRRNSVADFYEQNIASRQQFMDRLTPETQCRVGQVWWALQVVHQSHGGVMLLDVAREAEVDPVPVVTEPREGEGEPRSCADADTTPVREASPTSGLLEATCRPCGSVGCRSGPAVNCG